MERDEETTSVSVVKGARFTGCGCISLLHGVMTLSGITLIIGILLTTRLVVYIVKHANTMPWDEIAASSTSLGFWSGVIGLTIFGSYAVWKEKSGLVELYFWMFTIHWLLDLASTVVLLVVVHQKWQAKAQGACSKITPRQACIWPYKLSVILLTCALCLYKLLGAVTWYLLYRYRSALIAVEKENAPIVRWLKRTSTSSLSSIFEKKWWSPSQVPVIKIDFASDQSSASSYSNDSAGYQTVSFGQQIQQQSSLAAPSALQMPQQAMFAPHIGDGLTASHELPVLPSYSVVGSSRGALT